MKMEEVRQMADEELQTEVDRLHRHLFDVRAQAVTEKLEDPTLITRARRDIARMLTEQNQRSRASPRPWVNENGPNEQPDRTQKKEPASPDGHGDFRQRHPDH